MKKTLLTAVSTIALLSAVPAHADTEAAHKQMNKQEAAKVQQDNAVVTKQELKEGWNDTKNTVSETAESISSATQNAYEDVKATFIDENTSIAGADTIMINQRSTADYLIGQPVYSATGERVAKIRDIILDSDGNAMMVVLGDGDFTGLGKMVAYDYSILTTTNNNGEISATLNEEMIDNAASFSYDRADYSDAVRVIPSNGYSVASLLEANIVTPDGDAIGDVENIAFKNGEADTLVVGVNETLGFGGDTIALSFDDTNVVQKDGDLQFQLSANQSDQFEEYKNQL